jgi:DNA helicase HerA-like ATPase
LHREGASSPEERMRQEIVHYNEVVWRSVSKQASVASMPIGQKMLLRHVLILGSTGSGKTNHAFHIIQEAFECSKGLTCVVIDVKREYRALKRLLEQPVEILAVGDEPLLTFNPLVPPTGVSAELWDRAFADVFTRAYGLSEPSRRILLDSLFSLRQSQRDVPTIRELEREVSRFEAGSPKEQNSQRSLESRLHLINTGPVGASLNSTRGLSVEKMEGRLVVFEVGRIDSLRDQRFVAEVLMLFLWYYDKFHPVEEEERLKRLIVVEEAHRYLSEERPSAQRGDRTLLELAIAEARRYGWGFVIVDQMPLLLSRYVWDNMGSIAAHRLSNVESLTVTVDALGGNPLKEAVRPEDFKIVALTLPEELAMFRSYVENPRIGTPSQGVTRVRRVTTHS